MDKISNNKNLMSIYDHTKRRYHIIIGIVGVIYFLLQIFLPILIFISLIKSPLIENVFSEIFILQDSKKYWNGKIWYLTRNIFDQNYTLKLISKPLNNNAPKKLEANLNTEKAIILPHKDNLWVISDNTIFIYKNNKFTPLATFTPFKHATNPFIYKNEPAIINKIDSQNYGIYLFKNNQWQFEELFPLGFDINNLKINFDNMQIIYHDNKPHFFLEYKGTLYHRDSIKESENPWDTWQPIAKINSKWATTLINNKLLIVYVDNSYIKTINASTGEKNILIKLPTSEVNHLSVFSIENSNNYILIIDSLYDTSYIYKINDKKINEQKTSPNQFTPFTFYYNYQFLLMLYPSTLVLPLVTSAILTLIMRKYRINKYIYNDKEEHFASVIRRGIAQILGTIILSVPFIIIFYILKPNKHPITSSDDIFKIYLMNMALIIFSFLIGFSINIIFAFMDGKWGQTPGKWALQIKVVGFDLKPCGFKRSFIRTILSMVDGALGYMIGLLLVALTENWQRLGDLIANTIVINKKKA